MRSTIASVRLSIIKFFIIPDTIIAKILASLYRRRNKEDTAFGWMQAFFGSVNIDQWQRYASVAEEIKKLDRVRASILDVGTQQAIIAHFINPIENDLCLLDISTFISTNFEKSNIRAIVGDGCNLPFKDGAFNIVISLDSLEHIPNQYKADYCSELKRVAMDYVILHCPVDSVDGEYQSTVYDEKFLKWHRRFLKTDNIYTLEHLNSGLPQLEQLKALFPNVQIQPRQNCQLWFIYMRMLVIPYVRFIAGVFYKLFLMRKEGMPPFKSCLLVWRKGY